MIRHIEACGHRIAVDLHDDHPQGPLALWWPGILTPLDLWSASMRISDGPLSSWPRRVSWAAVSLPGHAPSSVPRGWSRQALRPHDWAAIYEAVLAAIAAPDRELLMVGHSTGGFVALLMAAHLGERVRAVLSVAGFACGRFGGPLGALQRLCCGSRLAQASARATLAAMHHDRRGYLYSTAASAGDRAAYLSAPGLETVLDEVHARARAQDWRPVIEVMAALRTCDIRAQLDRIQASTTVFAGERDTIVPLSHARELAQAVPDARLVIASGAGHMAFAERPDLFARELELICP